MKKQPLSSLCDIKNGYAFKSTDYTGTGFRVIRITNVQKGIVVDNDPKFIPDKLADKADNFKLKKDDILISLTGNVGRVGRIEEKLLPAVLNQRVGLIRINSSKLHDKYLFQYLNSDTFENEAITNSNGVAQLNLSSKWVENHQIPLPPIDDQKRIAHLLGKVEGMIARRKQHLQQLDELLKSVFLEMFGDPVRNEKGWEKIKVDDFAEVRIGPFGSLLHSEDYIQNGIPLINPSHIIDGEIVPDKTQTITFEKYRELESYQLKINDIVVARRGEIGRCALVRVSTPLFCGTGSMFIRITSNYYPMLLQYQIYNTSLKEYLLSKAKGVTMKNLNSTTLGNLQVLNPPIPLQNQFAAIVEKVESMKSRYQSSLSNLENLYGALSQKAFKGELDLGRVPLPEEKEIDSNDVDTPFFDKDLSDTIKKTLTNLNTFNQNSTAFKSLHELAHSLTIKNPLLKDTGELVNQMAKFKSPLEELKNIPSFARTMTELIKSSAIVSKMTEEHKKSIQQITKTANQIASSFSNFKISNMGWMEEHKKLIESTQKPFNQMQETMVQLALPAKRMQDLLNSYSVKAQDFQGTIPNYTSWKYQPEFIDFEDNEEQEPKRIFMRCDILDALKKSGPSSFDALLKKLSEVEIIDFLAYERIKELLFELVADGEIKQHFDENDDILKLKIAV